MTDKLKPVPYATPCRCGHGMAKNDTARYDRIERLYYDCHLCRPRPASPRCESNGYNGCTCEACW